MERIQLHLLGSHETMHLGINCARFSSIRHRLTGFYITRFLKCFMWLKTFQDFFESMWIHVPSMHVCVPLLAVIYPAYFLCVMTGATNMVSRNIISHIPQKSPKTKISGTHVTNDTCWCPNQRICKGVFIGIGLLLWKAEFFKRCGLCLHSVVFALTWYVWLKGYIWDIKLCWKPTEQHSIRIAISLLSISSYKRLWKECLMFKMQP